MSLYYQPSKRITVGGVLSFVLLGALAAVPLAFIYVYATWYIPFIYINVLLTLGFGAVLAVVLKLLTKAGKLRHPALVGWLAVLVGLWAWYVQWALYLTLLDGAGETESLGRRASFTHTTFEADVFLTLLTRPDIVLGMLPRLAENGTWGIFTVTVSGVFLYLVWLAELAIIVFFSWALAHSQAGTPFSETAGQWADQLTFPVLTPAFTNVEATKAALEAADWAHLQPLAAGEEAPSAFGRLHLFHAPQDEDCCYLSLENVTIEIDKKGKPSEKTTDVVEYLRLSPSVCRELHARFGTAAVPAESVTAS
ncbi:hypothetical protein [Hymenobacter chitinivorans]|uniref:Uncharacterized protein n=1 Tax=Hymenobacter chitinivorans DSM 11115 TaxID=1121954 RepID=A0A2M9B9H0_9BACT|nr:hypothetical protein [Hymenobacter chitinivorans]PJJ54567.1 hypothetical protein CLV45_2908 [Hymenobacter chitinivorans DSM 11115]